VGHLAGVMLVQSAPVTVLQRANSGGSRVAASSGGGVGTGNVSPVRRVGAASSSRRPDGRAASAAVNPPIAFRKNCVDFSSEKDGVGPSVAPMEGGGAAGLAPVTAPLECVTAAMTVLPPIPRRMLGKVRACVCVRLCACVCECSLC
jgi:hypothetical protein